MNYFLNSQCKILEGVCILQKKLVLENAKDGLELLGIQAVFDVAIV